jgi:N-acetylmuramoyl-L-alanine amidase
MMKYTLFSISMLLFFACGSSKEIVDKPIIFDEERIELTKDYLLTRYGLEKDNATITPKMIVLHWTHIPTLQQSFDAFYESKLPSRPDIATASSLNVSSQFLVDLDGAIYRLMPETTMARHVIGLNHIAIGVENVGGTADVPLTKAQIKSNIWLVNYLSKKYPIDYLIGHFEYTNFDGHELWLEVDNGYRTEKVDPGADFMKAVKKGTRKLNLKSAPPKTNSAL